MVDKKKVDAAVEFFTETNGFYKKKYEEAPSDACRKKIVLEFYFSMFWDMAHEDEDFFRLQDETEHKLDLNDWQYLLKYQGHNPGVVKIRKNIERLAADRHKGS